MKFFIFAVVFVVCAYASGEECCGGLPRRKVKVHDDEDPEIKVIYTGQACECQKALPYKIEVPVVEKQILRKHKYAIEKLPQPKPKPCFIYNAKVEVPVSTQQVQYEGLKTKIDRIVMPDPDCAQPCDIPEPDSAEVCHKCKKTSKSCGCKTNIIVKETGYGSEESSIESCGCNQPQESSEEICQKSSEETVCGCSKCQKPKKTCGCGKIYSSEESDCGCVKSEESAEVCKKIKYASEEIDCGCKMCQESEEEEEVCTCNRRPVSSGESCGEIIEDSSEEISCGCQVHRRSSEESCEEKKGSCEESEEEICTKDSAEGGNCGCSKCTQAKPECESEEESVERCACGNKRKVHVKYGKFYSPILGCGCH